MTLYNFEDVAIPDAPHEQTEIAKILAHDTEYKFGTIIADPPWEYGNTSVSEKLSGYASSSDAAKHKYSVLSTEDLCNLPVGDYADDDAVLLMWTTWPFIADALKVIDAWGFEYKTGLPMIKTDSKEEPKYGVGYWIRGCTEPLLIAKRKKGKSYRSSNIGFLTTKRDEPDGLLTPALSHSRKPNHQYELGETYPGPRLEVFARGQSAFDHGWYALGNEAHLDGHDIMDSSLWTSTWDAQSKEMTK